MNRGEAKRKGHNSPASCRAKTPVYVCGYYITNGPRSNILVILSPHTYAQVLYLDLIFNHG